MSEIIGECAEFERATGMPPVEKGCCWSCIGDGTDDMMEIDADAIGDAIAGLAPDALFLVCCAHYNAFNEWRATMPDKPLGAESRATTDTP